MSIVVCNRNAYRDYFDAFVKSHEVFNSAKGREDFRIDENFPDEFENRTINITLVTETLSARKFMGEYQWPSEVVTKILLKSDNNAEFTFSIAQFDALEDFIIKIVHDYKEGRVMRTKASVGSSIFEGDTPIGAMTLDTYEHDRIRERACELAFKLSRFALAHPSAYSVFTSLTEQYKPSVENRDIFNLSHNFPLIPDASNDLLARVLFDGSREVAGDQNPGSSSLTGDTPLGERLAVGLSLIFADGSEFTFYFDQLRAFNKFVTDRYPEFER